MTLSYFSTLAIVTSAVVYLLAMVAHAAEWAFARGTTGAARTLEVSPNRQASGGVAVLDRDGDTEPHSAVSSTPESTKTTSFRVDQYGRIGVALTLIAFGSALAGVVARGVAAQRPPWGNMYEFVTAAGVLVVALYLVLSVRYDLRWLGLPVTLLGAVLNGLAATVFYVAIGPLVPALHSVWFVIHIFAALTAGAAFNLGGFAAILYLVKARAEAKGTVTGYLAKLPSADQIDRLSYRLSAFAFPIWTFTIVAGAVWAEYAWGRYWGWDPKETWSLVTWVVYAGYLHARATAGWKGRRAAWLAILGLALFWFNFVGVNLLVSGLHSYAGI